MSNPNNVTATLRIRCQKYMHTGWRILRTLSPLASPYYKVQIHIDNSQHYTLNSKDECMDITLTPGVHSILINQISNTASKISSVAGVATSFFGAASGNASTYVLGKSMESLGQANQDGAVNIEFAPGSTLEFKVKQNGFQVLELEEEPKWI